MRACAYGSGLLRDYPWHPYMRRVSNKKISVKRQLLIQLWRLPNNGDPGFTEVCKLYVCAGFPWPSVCDTAPLLDLGSLGNFKCDSIYTPFHTNMCARSHVNTYYKYGRAAVAHRLEKRSPAQSRLYLLNPSRHGMPSTRLRPQNIEPP